MDLFGFDAALAAFGNRSEPAHSMAFHSAAGSLADAPANPAKLTRKQDPDGHEYGMVFGSFSRLSRHDLPPRKPGSFLIDFSAVASRPATASFRIVQARAPAVCPARKPGPFPTS